MNQFIEDVIDLTKIEVGGFDCRDDTVNSVFSLLQNTDLLVERGLALFKPLYRFDVFNHVQQYILIPTHDHYYYNFTTDVRYGHTHLVKTTTRIAPILNTRASYSPTEVMDRVAKLAIHLGCQDDYTKHYPDIAARRQGTIHNVPELMGMNITYKIIQDGHYTTIMFPTLHSQIDLYTPEIYQGLFTFENDSLIGIDEHYLVRLYLFKSSMRLYREWVRDQHKLDIILTGKIPYFDWLSAVLIDLSNGQLNPWVTPKTWRWVEHLGFINSHKAPLKTQCAERINTYLLAKLYGVTP